MKKIVSRLFSHEKKNSESIFPIFANIVLVCDDADINRFILKRFLLKINPELIIDEVSNGVDAVEKSKLFKYDIIFMDLIMPNMSGYDASKEIKKTKLNKNTVIVAITGQIEASSVEKALNYGIIRCVSKPISLSELSTIIQKKLK